MLNGSIYCVLCLHILCFYVVRQRYFILKIYSQYFTLYTMHHFKHLQVFPLCLRKNYSWAILFMVNFVCRCFRLWLCIKYNLSIGTHYKLEYNISIWVLDLLMSGDFAWKIPKSQQKVWGFWSFPKVLKLSLYEVSFIPFNQTFHTFPIVPFTSVRKGKIKLQ